MAKKAIQEMNGMDLEGRELRLDMAQPRGDARSDDRRTPRGGRGGRGTPRGGELMLVY